MASIVSEGVLIKAVKGKGITRDFTFLKANADTEQLSSDDKIRCIIGREGRTAKLTVSSDGATDNGSSFTKDGSGTAGTHRLRLDASDLDFASGVYSMWIDLYDSDDTNEWKHVYRHIFYLEDSGG